MFDRLHHVAVICADYERARHFYADVLGFAVIREVWRAERRSWECDLALGGGAMIELFSFPDPPPRPTRPVCPSNSMKIDRPGSARGAGHSG
ncbi:MAG: VOC family protein [Zavarzinia sp.]|nr:VOC family protein [Zavarzinia sp.]